MTGEPKADPSWYKDFITNFNPSRIKIFLFFVYVWCVVKPAPVDCYIFIDCIYTKQINLKEWKGSNTSIYNEL